MSYTRAMSALPVTRRDCILSLLALTTAPIVARSEPRLDTPAGSASYRIEMLAFRQPGQLPTAYPTPKLAIPTPIPGRVLPISAADLQLSSMAAALTKRGYPLLAHGGWTAIVPSMGRTTAPLEDVLPPTAPIVGAIAVQRGQILFLNVEIDYHVPSPDNSPTGVTYAMRERRRIRFAERHYFDHPAFGLIATVTNLHGSDAL